MKPRDVNFEQTFFQKDLADRISVGMAFPASPIHYTPGYVFVYCGEKCALACSENSESGPTALQIIFRL